jgi:flagellar basal-body rod protein FlgF
MTLMETGIYIAHSGQIALQRRLDTIANNVANMATPGFRAEKVTFQSVLSRDEVAYASLGKTSYSRKSGAITKTDNPLDLAIEGDAWFAISVPDGTSYTRDGRLRISPEGMLETLDGYPVHDAGGSPLQISPAQGPPHVTRDGTVSQSGTVVGKLGLFRLPADAALTQSHGLGFRTNSRVEAVADFNATGLHQGYIEMANVEPTQEMTRLIAVSRTFDAVTSAADQSDRRLSEAIRTLAGRR